MIKCSMIDKILHKWLRVPYTLNVRYHQKPKKSRATVILIHGIGNSGDAWSSVISKLPADIRIISVDLLGFGDSPRPGWALYNAKTQANSVMTTLLTLRTYGPITIVGHSLGALVGIELAKKYPLFVQSLVLCSPPLYQPEVGKKLLPSSDRILQRLYASVKDHPEQFVRLSSFATKYNLINASFNVTQDNVDSYIAALEAMIINQTSFSDIQQINVPTKIIRGVLDPFVITKNLKRLTKKDNITLTTVMAGHEVKGLYVPAVVKAVTETLGQK